MSRPSSGPLYRLATALLPVVVVALVTGAFGTPAAAAATAPHRSHAAPARVAGTFVPVPQFRTLDTGKSGGPVRAGHRLTVTLGGRHGIPANASAVAVTVHAVDPKVDGALTLFPAGSTAPGTTNLTYRRGQDTAQAAVVRLGHGAFTVLDRARGGTTQVAVDVSGYLAGGAVGAEPGLVHLLSSPVRALDTRHPGGYFRPHSVRTLQVKHGVPTSHVGAVAVMLTAVDPAASGSLIAYAAGNDQPLTPTTRFDAHRTATSFAWVPTHSDGSISIANTAARGTGVLLDVVGWANSGVAQTAGAFQPRFPDRLVSGAALAANRTRVVRVAGQGGVPLSNVGAVVASITVSGARDTGALLVGSTGTNNARRAVEFGPGRKPTDLVQLPLSNGGLAIHNLSRGPVTIAVDVLGFMPSATLAPPAVSISRYLGDLTENVPFDESIMQRHGCNDAKAMSKAGSRFVLLDVGAQSVTPPELNSENPGVSITQASGTVRLTDPQLVDVIQKYLAAFSQCGHAEPVTVAVGTNNDGAWDPNGDNYYPAADRGKEWASGVVNLLVTENGVTIVGASDIEPGFASTQAQAQQWENSYLSASTRKLIFNGSADGCSDGFGDSGGACSNGYTQQGLYNLAYNAGQVEVAPQIYAPSMATQWANIDKTGGGQLRFAGALTEHALAPDTYQSADGWAALYYAIGSLTSRPHIPAASDITNG